MSLVSAAFAKATMPDNNAMHQTRREGVALVPRRGPVVERALQVIASVRRSRDRHMGNTNRGQRAIRQLKIELRRGSSNASNNIAATYREIGNRRRAFHWWRRTAGPHDGSAWLEVGYCAQYGIGTCRDRSAAIRCYRQAIKTYHTSEFAQEEARYHLAVALIDRDDARGRREAQHLLSQAAEDGDYKQATDLLLQLSDTKPRRICRCRRELPRRLGGKARCPLHRGRT
jgi:TPR repeat protein